jgi:hypothetical protein
MPHLPPAHHETSKRDSPHETKVKKQNKTISDSNSNIAKLMTHHNQTKELITWFLRKKYYETLENFNLKYSFKYTSKQQQNLSNGMHLPSRVNP